MELAGILDTHHITYTLHHAYCTMIAGTVGAYRADISIAYHHALTAILYLVPQVVDSRSKVMNILLRLLEKMKSKTQSASAPHSRQ